MIIEPITARRAVREYENTDISDSQLEDIIRAGQFAPTAHHNASVEFVIIRDPKIKNALFALLDQEFVRDVPVLIAPILDREKSVAPVQDLSVTTENMFLQATAMGLGTVWKNVPEKESEKVKKLLGIPDRYLLINLIPVGYPKGEIIPHSDADFSAKKIHHEKF
ncbi:MAG: nitroreductase family protein [Candidatus Peribacteraceae bacterium]|nr:nitroreductase family protein [Candidatus Peribacteraceae bacterium]